MRLKIYYAKRDTQTDTQTDRRTSRLLDRIGPVGRFDENPGYTRLVKRTRQQRKREKD